MSIFDILKMGKFALSLAKSSPVTVGLIIVLAGIVTGYLTVLRHQVHQGGVNACLADIAKEEKAQASLEAIENERQFTELKKKIADYEEKLSISSHNLGVANKTIQDFEDISQEIDYEIRNKADDGSCTVFGTEYFRLFNKPLQNFPSI